jgi:hypothetical protein
MAQLVSSEPPEGRRYWTATLVKATPPADGEDNDRA